MTRNVAILIFDDVEILDFCGPFEVFSVAERSVEDSLFNVYIVSEFGNNIYTRNGLKIEPKYSIFDCPAPDILIIPGGQGSRIEMNNLRILNWIKECEKKCQLVLSVCTGALLLANCGLLAGIKATTHYLSYDLLQKLETSCQVIRGKRFIDSGKIITSGGISAGIDMSLYVVSKLYGNGIVEKTKEIMEYDWSFDI